MGMIVTDRVNRRSGNVSLSADYTLDAPHILGLEVTADDQCCKRAKSQFQRSFNEDLIGKGQLQRATDAKEALTVQMYITGEFEKSLAFAKQWIAEESFSSRAYMAAAAAASAADNYPEAETLARKGLRYEPRSAYLRNSLAFALASQGRGEDAERVLREIKFEDDDRTTSLVSEANRGLIAMRQGDIVRGEGLYRKVIAGFRHQQDQRMMRSAMAYFAREAVRAGHPKAMELVAQAKDGFTSATNPLSARVLGSIDRLLSAQSDHRLPSSAADTIEAKPAT